jgi:hypothetical protein
MGQPRMAFEEETARQLARRTQNLVSMSETRLLSVAPAEFALHKFHMTLTILRKNKNTTTTNLLTPTSDLRLAQRSDGKKPGQGFM